MTQPVGFSPSLNYTPYDPDLDRCQPEGTGGAGGSSSGGAEGASGNSSGGAEGASGSSKAQPVAPQAQDCTSELLTTVAACGSAYLTSKASPLLALLPALACVGNAMELVECLTEPEIKPQGQ